MINDWVSQTMCFFSQSEHLFFMTKKFITRKIIGKNYIKEKRIKIIRKRNKKNNKIDYHIIKPGNSNQIKLICQILFL